MKHTKTYKTKIINLTEDMYLLIKIVYCPSGDALSEFVVEEYVSNLIKTFKQNDFFRDTEKIYEFSTEFPVQCIVYEVMSGTIPKDTISFWDQDDMMDFSMAKGLCEQDIKPWSMTKMSDIFEKQMHAGIYNLHHLPELQDDSL